VNWHSGHKYRQCGQFAFTKQRLPEEGAYDRCARSPISAYWQTGTAAISTVSVASSPLHNLKPNFAQVPEQSEFT